MPDLTTTPAATPAHYPVERAVAFVANVVFLGLAFVAVYRYGLARGARKAQELNGFGELDDLDDRLDLTSKGEPRPDLPAFSPEFLRRMNRRRR